MPFIDITNNSQPTPAGNSNTNSVPVNQTSTQAVPVNPVTPTAPSSVPTDENIKTLELPAQDTAAMQTSSLPPVQEIVANNTTPLVSDLVEFNNSPDLDETLNVGRNITNLNVAQPVSVNSNNQGVREFSVPSRIATESKPVNDIANNLHEKINAVQTQLPVTPTPSSNIMDPSMLTEKKYTLEELLNIAVKMKASDLHLSVGYRAMVRVDGVIQNLPSQLLDNQTITEYIKRITVNYKAGDVSTLDQIDLSYQFGEVRFRINIFKTMGNYSIVFRVIPAEVKSVEDLMLPPQIKEFARITNGLVLVTGPTGSGKSTSIASILNYINLTRSEHIITLEDPVEFVFPKGLSLVDQREFGSDFASWNDALKSLLRQDPDVVLVGEMRDFETMASTITVSETGHLVFATLHTNSAAQTIDRIIDVFPEAQQAQIRAQLANVLQAVVSQRLVPLTGGGRRAVVEIMLASAAVRNAIREGKTHQIDNIIQTSKDIGMISMEQSLVDLVKSGLVSIENAKSVSNKPDELDILLKQAN